MTENEKKDAEWFKWRYSVKMDRHEVTERLDDVEWAKSERSNHYLLVLHIWMEGKSGERRTLPVWWSQGKGCKQQPQITGVLEALKLDCSFFYRYGNSPGHSSFSAWCDETGLDSDSLKAMKSYEYTKKLAKDFIKWLGFTAKEFFEEVAI